MVKCSARQTPLRHATPLDALRSLLLRRSGVYFQGVGEGGKEGDFTLSQRLESALWPFAEDISLHGTVDFFLFFF